MNRDKREALLVALDEIDSDVINNRFILNRIEDAAAEIRRLVEGLEDIAANSNDWVSRKNARKLLEGDDGKD